MTINFDGIFSESFDTFKVFENLEPAAAGKIMRTSLPTIWQTLNHVLLWQKHQLEQLSGERAEAFHESATWITEKQPLNQQELDEAVTRLYQHLEVFKKEIKELRVNDSRLEQKLRILHEAATHLSFHVGEIVYQRRMAGDYPLPDKMSSFLRQ